MAGETEILDYDDYKVMLEFDWQLDGELQDLVEKMPATETKITEIDEKSASYTEDKRREPMSPKESREDPSKYDDPFFRCRSENEARK